MALGTSSHILQLHFSRYPRFRVNIEEDLRDYLGEMRGLGKGLGVCFIESRALYLSDTEFIPH